VVRRRIEVGALGVALLAAACSLAFPLDRYHNGTAVDASLPGDASTGHVPTCKLARPPPPPPENDPGSGDLNLVFALRSTSARADAGSPTEPGGGYDLDGYCSCTEGDPQSCISDAAPCDGTGGVDNEGFAILKLISAFPALAKFSPEAFERYVAQGTSTMLVTVHGYNGMPNDTQVEVGILVSDGRLVDAGDPINTAPPLWDGKDVWSTMAATVNALGIPINLDPKGYVSGGVLVARLTSTDGGGPVVPMLGLAGQVTGGFMAGRIVHEGDLWQLHEGIFAGRLPISRVFSLLSTVDDPLVDGGHLCGPDSQTFGYVKKQLCDRADISAGAASDGLGLACDAISIGMGFEATQALQGGIGIDPPVIFGCGPTFTDTCQ
jgi:hypothetical protein